MLVYKDGIYRDIDAARLNEYKAKGYEAVDKSDKAPASGKGRKQQ